MSRQSLSLSAVVHNYLISHTVKACTVKQELRQRTSDLAESNMQISPEQGQFMAVLARLISAKKVLEIGTFTGYSSLCVAEVLPEDGQLIACDVSETWTNIAKEYWQMANVADKIDLRLGQAITTLKKLIEDGNSQTFDMVFIDADKINYKNYYELSLKLLRQGGAIMIDNVLWGGKVADSAITDKETLAIREFNDFIFNDTRVKMCMLPLSDGVTLAYKA
ncbi:Putative O-methyltransferase [Piscirickettsia salmonis]|uniref:O-methyltransferase, family 3 n=1 Tax=Piscirickettsia salmonis TaxID=1238 RepID=A0A1L6TH11_PISSA|nr:class I SAM-dependent methyltransferase [Piscirickettsia salmonis]ALB21724.1 O-methyltransferase, family 3 [Piscirickettsia salmonis]ALT18147.1 SAM-dependent methyltransferase [Piscirickettsia salmonis LF-89 = ATCC VR-1361]ALY01919.1 SAM-dependent methyltransferase [Piscirickettsia salmonis]AMA41427.1 SAM-dependent methyltransferase [Piscirickettsia salmonis]AOS36632.1 SAM-dependent methyltransferase [Piscirickettsia salmonis]